MDYSITFRLGGGSVEAGKLAEALDLKPKYQRTIGDKILDRQGKLIRLVDRNFCSFDLPEADIVAEDFAMTLGKFLDRIEQASVLLSDLSLSGAKFSFYVVLHDCINQGEVFHSTALGRLSKLKIDLCIGIAK